MKKTLLLIAVTLMYSSIKAQTDSLCDKGVSIQASGKMSEVLVNGVGAELMVMRFNHDHVFQPYISFTAGVGGIRKDGLWEYNSFAFSGRIGAACRLTDADNDGFRLYLRPGIGYIRRNERLEIIVENEHWGTGKELLKENSGSIFLDMGLRMEAKVSSMIVIVAEPSFYTMASRVREVPFDDRVDYRQQFKGTPNPGLGAGRVLGINLSAGIGILIR